MATSSIPPRTVAIPHPDNPRPRSQRQVPLTVEFGRNALGPSAAPHVQKAWATSDHVERARSCQPLRQGSTVFQNEHSRVPTPLMKLGRMSCYAAAFAPETVLSPAQSGQQVARLKTHLQTLSRRGRVPSKRSAAPNCWGSIGV